MDIAILGSGGVGGFLAAALCRAGEDVAVVARERTAQVLLRDGFDVESVHLGNFSAEPRVLPGLAEPVDVLFVATKATALPEALERIQAPPRLIVPLLNGLEHMALLRDRFGAERVAAGVIRVESNSPRPGQIRQTSPSVRIDLAADNPGLRPQLEAVAAVLEQAGIPARVEDSEAHVLWSKLARLVALACTTSACGETIGFIRSDPEWRKTLTAAAAEAAAVANADGGGIDPAAPLAELDDAHPSLGSSMQRDLAAGREPELDAIAGAVIRTGRRYGIETPTIERLSWAIAQRAGLTQLRTSVPLGRGRHGMRPG